MVTPEARESAYPNDATEVLGPEAVLAPLSDEHILPRGEPIGEYVVEELIGGGGGGVVYAARHRATEVRVAIKVLRPEMAAFPVMIARFAREVEALRKLAHPNIVELYGFGELAAGRPYYVMELLEGVDLRTRLVQVGRFTASEALELFQPICEAVEAAHRAGIIHRDLKTSNVLVDESTGTRRVKLLDFGIAKLRESESAGEGLTEPGAVIGSAHNMAPEQVRCERVDERTDIYALGVMLFQLLTGQFPFQSDDPHRVALLHLTAPIPRPSLLAAVSPALDAVVLRCMAKQPAQRFASVAELLLTLRAALDERTQRVSTGGRALAVHIALSEDETCELDDALLERFMGLLDEVEGPLLDAGFALPLRTASALLAVRLLEHDEAQPALEELASELCTRARAAARSERIAVHARSSVGRVEYRVSEDDCVEIVGGPLLEVDAWPVPSEPTGT